MTRAVVLALLVLGLLAAPARAFDPAYEQRNFSKQNERAAIYSTPEYQAKLRTVSAQNQADAAQIQATDPERQFNDHLCGSYMDGCAGDVRLYDWGPKGYGMVEKVLYTARDGATISGRVWATRAGPAKRPGVVITNGSVQASETLYWFVAQTLAKAGYVVMTFDPQGQGRSDTRGEAPDDGEGVPAQRDGRPFFDGTVDALDFFLSDVQHPYVPRPSCTTGTVHRAKQDRRVAATLNSPANPFAALIDRSRIGIAGHSYGAFGVSFVGQKDPRVKAVLAFDHLNPPTSDAEQPCPADPASRAAPPITKPALDLTADYFIPPTPNRGDPDPNAKAATSKLYSRAGVDTGSIVIRGGTHFDFDWIPNPAFGATLRGADLITWYTTAWFDKELKGDPTADRRLLTDRWRHDAAEGAVDPDGDANMLSRYYRSRLDLGLAGGGRFTCEDLRAGCAGMGPDGEPGAYDYVSIATSPDRAGAGAGAGTGAAGGGGAGASGAGTGASAGSRACTSRRWVRVRVRLRRGERLRSVRVTIAGRRVPARRAGHRRVVVDLRGRPKGRVVVRVRARTSRGRTVRATHRYRLCAGRRGRARRGS